MIILSIDSSSKCLSVALKIDDSIDQNCVNDERASKVILIEIDKILKKYNIIGSHNISGVDYWIQDIGMGGEFTYLYRDFFTKARSSICSKLRFKENPGIFWFSPFSCEDMLLTIPST